MSSSVLMFYIYIYIYIHMDVSHFVSQTTGSEPFPIKWVGMLQGYPPEERILWGYHLGELPVFQSMLVHRRLKSVSVCPQWPLVHRQNKTRPHLVHAKSKLMRELTKSTPLPRVLHLCSWDLAWPQGFHQRHKAHHLRKWSSRLNLYPLQTKTNNRNSKKIKQT